MADKSPATPRLVRQARKKLPYVPPRLIEYGSAAKLSAYKPGSINDGANLTHKRLSCL